FLVLFVLVLGAALLVPLALLLVLPWLESWLTSRGADSPEPGLKTKLLAGSFVIAGALLAVPAALVAGVFAPIIARVRGWNMSQDRLSAQHKLLYVVGAVVFLVVLLPLLNPARIRAALSERAEGADAQVELHVSFDPEFHSRPDGYRGLCSHYGFEFRSKPHQMETGLMYKAAAEGSVDVIDGFATDGRIAAYKLYALEDDRGFFPPYYAAPLARSDTLRQHPNLRGILGALAGRIDDDAMRRLNYEADEKGRKAAQVAREFLVEEGIIDTTAGPGAGNAGTIVIGGKNFTEQEILGELLAILIESKTNLKVVRKLNLSGTMVCFNALTAGDLDLYAEYTGTGLVSILKEDAINDPDEAYEHVKEVFAERYGLEWLEPFGFNNTYTLTMREEQADALGIHTISDLARYVDPSFEAQSATMAANGAPSPEAS
ncbi:MAG TPA: hypothetical protein ENN80_02400, partial [Candidatus Hydrogenedentes bacterium]|nr:hypothetical protein [Candidatus Hydrogenedentota bacterium]